MQQLARAIDGMAAACRALATPIVSGNVSLYNETDGRAILPTPTVAAVGLIADPQHVTEIAFREPGRRIVLLGGTHAGPLGGSEWVAAHTGEVKGTPPSIDLALEARLQKLLLALVRRTPKLVASAHDVSDGGLVIALAECCLAAAHVGATVALPGDEPIAALLFGEAPSRIVVSVRADHLAEVRERTAAAAVGYQELGETGGDRLVVTHTGRTLVDVPLGPLHDARERCLESIVGA
jgi:phosphoribosylformylglycinamidine synthase